MNIEIDQVERTAIIDGVTHELLSFQRVNFKHVIQIGDELTTVQAPDDAADALEADAVEDDTADEDTTPAPV